MTVRGGSVKCGTCRGLFARGRERCPYCGAGAPVALPRVERDPAFGWCDVCGGARRSAGNVVSCPSCGRECCKRCAPGHYDACGLEELIAYAEDMRLSQERVS